MIFTEQSWFVFELLQRLDPANPPASMQPTLSDSREQEAQR